MTTPLPTLPPSLPHPCSCLHSNSCYPFILHELVLHAYKYVQIYIPKSILLGLWNATWMFASCADHLLLQNVGVLFSGEDYFFCSQHSLAGCSSLCRVAVALCPPLLLLWQVCHCTCSSHGKVDTLVRLYECSLN